MYSWWWNNGSHTQALHTYLPTSRSYMNERAGIPALPSVVDHHSAFSQIICQLEHAAL